MKQVDASPFFYRLISWSLDHPFGAPARYVLATLLILLIAAVRAAVVTHLLPWLMFVPGILVVGLLLGRGAGYYATLLSAACAGLAIAAPGVAWWLSGEQWVASALFVLVGAGIVALSAEVRAAFRRARLLVTEREAAAAALLERDAQRELLNQEMGHRVKNLLAVVQAIVGQTMRQSVGLREAEDAIGARLSALGKATTALTVSEWGSADLRTLVCEALGSLDSEGGRVSVAGPPVRFGPQLALALTLTFHELFTNAMKYGALSNDAGRVSVDWSIDGGSNPDDRRFRLTWREDGGPPVDVPSRRGFGSAMIERSLKSYMRGTTMIEYRREGIVFTIDAPLPGAGGAEG